MVLLRSLRSLNHFGCLHHGLLKQTVFILSGEGKGPSDGVGGVIKRPVVFAEKKIILNVNEVFDYLHGNYTIFQRAYTEGHSFTLMVMKFNIIEKKLETFYLKHDGPQQLLHVRAISDLLPV